MKQVEREEVTWEDDLSDKLERALDRRIRHKEQLDRKLNIQTGERKGKDKQNLRNREEFIYCAAFNKGNCTEPGSHKGKFGGREGVILNHACKRCLQEKGQRVGHSELDDRCPFKTKE